MMYCKFQVYSPSANTWSDFGKIVSPVDFGESIKADVSAAYSIKLYFKPSNTTALTPGTFCRINMDSRTFEFVVIDGGQMDPVGPAAFCYHVYTIQELLAYAREIYIQKSFFSFGRYTLPQFTTRFFALCKSDMVMAMSTAEAGYQLMLDNWLSPDYQVSSNAALDNLIKIGSNLQVRLKARIGTAGTFELYAKKLIGEGTADFSNGRFNGRSSQYKGSTYASKIVANVENMTTDQYFWYPSMNASFGCDAEPLNEEETVISATTMVFKTIKPIKAANSVRVYGFGKVITDSVAPYSAGTNYKFFDLDGDEIVADSGKYTYLKTDPDEDYRPSEPIFVTYPIFEYEQWRLLDVDGSGAATYHQANSLYYKRNDNRIYNISICAGAATSANSSPICVYKTYDSSWNLLTTVNKYQAMHAHANRYSVNVNLYFDGKIENMNDLGGFRTTIYSQDDNVVSGKTFLSNMQGSIDSMKNVEDTISYIFDDIDDVPEAGTINGGKVISEVNIRVTYSQVKATFVLSDDLVAKSEYASGDAGLVLPQIPIGKAYDRFTNYGSTIWITRTSVEAQGLIDDHGEDEYINSARFSKFIDALDNGRETYPAFPSEVVLRTGDGAATYVYTAVKVTTAAVKNLLIMAFKTLDNASVGFLLDKSAGSDIEDYKYYPVTFINPTGMCEEIYFKIIDYSYRTTEANYPAISQSTFDNAVSVLFSADDAAHHHDSAETLNVNNQIGYKGRLASTLVHQSFIEECTVMKDTYSSPDIYHRYAEFDSKIKLIESIVCTTTDNIVQIKAYIVDSTVTTSEAKLVKFFRSSDSGVTKDYMLEMETVLVVSGTDKYFQFYAAFTK